MKPLVSIGPALLCIQRDKRLSHYLKPSMTEGKQKDELTGRQLAHFRLGRWNACPLSRVSGVLLSCC